MQAIINGFREIISLMRALAEGLVAFFKWIPTVLRFGTSGFLSFLPAAFIPVVTMCLVIMVVKIIVGGDNS